MSCDVTKFTINKGVDNTFLFTVKANGSTLPLNISVGTFYSKLVPLDPGVVGEQDLTPYTVKTNEPSGQLTITVSAALADTLISEKGPKEDRFYAKPTYKLIIEAADTTDGSFLAVVPEVYVD